MSTKLPPAAVWANLTTSQWNALSTAKKKSITDSYNQYLYASQTAGPYNPFTPFGVPTSINYQYFETQAAKAAKKYTTKQPLAPNTNPYKGPFKFNAPMVNDAYFNPLAGLKAHGLYGYVDKISYTDAAQAWQDGNGSKGAFQMDRSLNTAANLAVAQKALAAGNTPTQIDTTMYGFRFMYNPTTVDMAWGAVMSANPQYEGLNLDVVQPITSNLMNSTISFDILINRIEDMSYLNPDGSFIYSSDPDTQLLLETAVANQTLNQLAGLNAGVPQAPANPYPSTVPVADRKAIYEKGTMYDIEYLFKSLHGFDGQSLVNTTLMKTTSDPGWLPVIPVELHLGNSMRYRVRVSSLSVHHSVFNVRMVPILSTISITCNRYYDYATMLTTNPKKK